MTKEIPLSRGQVALVDDEDYHKLSLHRWYCTSKGYAARKQFDGERWRMIFMHRIIMGATDPKVEVDHINFVKSDNRRCNLRLCTHQQNHAHKPKPENGKRSRHKGVSWHAQTRKWMAACAHHTIGFFVLEDDAARAYNLYAIEHYGEFAVLNDVDMSVPILRIDRRVVKGYPSFPPENR